MSRTGSLLAAALLAAAPPAQRAEEGWVVHAVALSPGGATAALGRFHAEEGTGRLCFVDVASGGRREFPSPGAVLRALQFTGDGKRLAAGADDGKVRIVEVATGKVLATHEAHRGWVVCVALSEGCERLLSAGADSVLRLAETATGRELWRVQRSERITAVAFAPDGRVSCGLANGDVELWRQGEERPQAVLRQCERAITAMAFTADGRLAAAGHAEEGFVFELASGGVHARWRGHSARVRALRIDPDGESLWAASDDRHVRRVRMRDGAVLEERRLAGVPMALASTAGGKLVVADSAGRTDVVGAR